jgi:MtrB/PioB family decaheme-associated outer membrane protein
MRGLIMCSTRVLAVIALALAPALAAAQAPSPTPSQTSPPAGPAAPSPGAQPPAGQTPAAQPAPEPQQPAAAQEAPEEVVAPSDTPWAGWVDFGVRGTSTNGDAARYERYRDLGDGLFLETARVSRTYRGWLLDFMGDHVGRRDARYGAAVEDPGRIKAAFLWDQIPMLLSRTTRTLYSGIGTGDLTIDDSLQAIVQARPAAIEPVFDEFSRPFDLKTRRHIADGSFSYQPTTALTFSTDYRHTDRDGTIPYGGSFGHSSLVEFPAPTEYTINEFQGEAEYATDPMILRAGYSGSWFHNDVTSIAFDNPFRLTDIPATSSRGRLALAPSNSFIDVHALGSVKLPGHSRATAYISTGSLTDADPTAILPQTINSSIVTQPLERTTVEGKARTLASTLTFVSRPRPFLDFDVRFRSYDYDNQTPIFTLTERVAYDNTPARLSPPVETEPFGVLRTTLDATARWTPGRHHSAGVGYGRTYEERTYRIYESTTENSLNLTYDTVGWQWLSIRSRYEYGEKRGTGIEEGELELAAIGEQPGMRHYDVAPRNRNRFTLLGTVTPLGTLSATFSAAAGKDDYIQSEFGLRDNTHRVYTAGADYVPVETVIFSGSYSYERYAALNRSRQANPGPEFDDPSRNWAADVTDRAHSLILSTDVKQIGGKVDLRLAYDFNRSRGTYHYITGPIPDRTLPEEVEVPTSLPPPSDLPPTLTQLQRATSDLFYALSSRLSLGLSFWYERYDVQDFTLDIQANPELARGQALLMGYLYTPYTARTVWGRVLYRF